MLQLFGNLNNGSNAGLSCVNGNNGLGNARWNIGSRQSGITTISSPAVYRPLAARRQARPHRGEIVRRPPG